MQEPENKGNEEAKEQEKQQEQNNDDKPLTIGDFNKLLQARDQALLEGFQRITDSVKQRDDRREEREEKKPTTEDVTKELGITKEQFWEDPVGAMGKFYETKVKPIAERGNAGPPVDLEARVQLELLNLKSRVDPAVWNEYQGHFQEVLKRTDPRVLATPGGMDATWRLTKSYADDMKDEEARKSGKHKQHAQLSDDTRTENNSSRKPMLSELEADMAERLGISHEDYLANRDSKEIEIGGARKEQKK